MTIEHGKRCMEQEDLQEGKMERIISGLVTAIGLVIFGYLTWYSFRYTYQFIPEYYEVFEIETDNLFLHMVMLLSLSAVIYGFSFIEKKLTDEVKNKAEKAVLFFFMACMTALGIWWVSIVHAQPCADQQRVVEGAYSLMDGNYEILQAEQYFGTYTYQLELAVIFRFLFTLCGVRDYHVIQYCNALCVPIIVYAGYKIVKYLGGKSKEGIFYCLLSLFCFPLLLYAPFVYGEIFSVMAGTLFLWGLMAFMRKRQKKLLFPIALCSVLGVFTRGNFWIVIIAAGIVLTLYAVKKREWMFLLLIAIITAAPICAKKGVEWIYEQRSGIALNQGVPIVSTIAMGVHDEGGQPAGWNNLHDIYAYALGDYKKEGAAEFSKEYLRVRLAAFRDGSADWKVYFKEKLLTQWEEPTWQGLMANHDFAKEPNELVQSIYYGKLKLSLLTFLNEYHLMLFVGSCLFFWYCHARKKPFYMLLPELILIGGVLFSLLWEAKTRYSFPYMIYMLPCTAVGFTWLSETVNMALGHRKGQNAKREKE